MRPIRLLSTTGLLVAVPLAVLPLSGCAAGKADATSKEHAPRVIDASAGPVLVRDVQISPAIGGSSTSPGASPSPGTGAGAAQAYLSFTLVSQAPDTLVGASVAGGQVSPTDSTASLTVRPQTPLIISDPDTGSSNPALAITGLTNPPVVGTTMKVTLTFQNAGTITVQAPVRDAVS